MRKVLFSLGALLACAGCEQPKMTMDMFAKPDKPTELARLDRFTGNWAGSAEMVSPTSAEMNEMIEDGSVPQYSKGGGNYKWVLDGRFLMSEGWHEMPNGERANYVTYMTWDPASKKYRSWYFSDYGEFGEGTMKFEDDNTVKSTAKGRGAGGESMQGKGKMTFVTDNKIEWTWEEGNLFHKMKIKGTTEKN